MSVLFCFITFVSVSSEGPKGCFLTQSAVQLAMRYLQDGYQCWEPVWDRGAEGDLDRSWKLFQKIYKKKHLFFFCITGLGQSLL